MLAGFDSVPGWVCVGAQWSLCRGRVGVSEARESLLARDSAVADRSHDDRKCWRGVPKVVPPPFCPVSRSQLGFGCGESPWQCLRRRPCLAMPVESRSAGTPSHCPPALELQLVTSPAPSSKRGSKEGKPIHWELQSGAEEPSRSVPGAPRTADLSCWLQEAHGRVPKAEQAGAVDTHVLGSAWAGGSGSQLERANLWDRDTWGPVSVVGRLPPLRGQCALVLLQSLL